MYTDDYTGQKISNNSQNYWKLTINSDLKLYAPFQTQNPDNCLSKLMDVDATNQNLSIILPDKYSIYPGYTASFVNVGENSFEIKDENQQSMFSLNPGKFVIIQLNQDKKWQFFFENNTTKLSSITINKPDSGIDIDPTYLDSNGTINFSLSGNLEKIEAIRNSNTGIISKNTNEFKSVKIDSSNSNILIKNKILGDEPNVSINLSSFLSLNSFGVGGVSFSGENINNLTGKNNSDFEIRSIVFNHYSAETEEAYTTFLNAGNLSDLYSYQNVNSENTLILPGSLPAANNALLRCSKSGNFSFSDSDDLLLDNILTPKDLLSNLKGTKKNICSSYISFSPIETENGNIGASIKKYFLSDEQGSTSNTFLHLIKTGVGSYNFNFANGDVNNFYSCQISAGSSSSTAIVSNFLFVKSNEDFFEGRSFLKINTCYIKDNVKPVYLDCDYVSVTVCYD